MTDFTTGYVTDQENIPPPHAEIIDVQLAKTQDKDRDLVEFEKYRQQFLELQNTEIGVRFVEEPEDLINFSCGIIDHDVLEDKDELFVLPGSEESVTIVREILNELMLSVASSDTYTVVEKIDLSNIDESNASVGIVPENGCGIQQDNLAYQKQSDSTSSSETTVIEQSRFAEDHPDDLVSPLQDCTFFAKESFVTPNSDGSSFSPEKEPENEALWITAIEAQSPQDNFISMPTQIDSGTQKLEEKLDTCCADLSLEASPGHTCKTDPMADVLSNENKLLDENTNLCQDSKLSDVENNKTVTDITIDSEALIVCTPKRKNEDEENETDGPVPDSLEISIPNGEHIPDKKDFVHEISTPLSGKKPVIGVASVNRRPVKSEPKPAAEDQSSNVQATNQSEAGPQVAEFTEEEFRSCAEVFKDPDCFEFLQKAGNSAAFQESTLSRLSLYVKFDPLVRTPGKHDLKNNSKNQLMEQQNRYSAENAKVIHEESENERPPSVGKLIDYTPDRKDTPRLMRMVSVEPVQKEQKLFTDGDMKKALQIQDILYRERLIAKDKEVQEKERSLLKADKEMAETKSSMSTTRHMMEEVVVMLKNWQDRQEQDRTETVGRNQKLVKERDQALEDLQNVESAFADLHRRYEKTKSLLENMKQNETALRDQLTESVSNLKKQEQMYDVLRSRTEEKLESANTEIEMAKRSGQSEIAVLGAQLKKAEMRIGSLERSLEQKNQDYAELSSIYDDLIARVGPRT